MKDGLLISQHLKGYHDAFRCGPARLPEPAQNPLTWAEVHAAGSASPLTLHMEERIKLSCVHRAADSSGNGLLSGDEVQSLLAKLGHKLDSGKLAKIMSQYDKDQ